MKHFLTQSHSYKDSGRHTANRLPFFCAAAVFTLLRLALCGGLWIKFASGSSYDDLMQITKAFSITKTGNGWVNTAV